MKLIGWLLIGMLASVAYVGVASVIGQALRDRRREQSRVWDPTEDEW